MNTVDYRAFGTEIVDEVIKLWLGDEKDGWEYQADTNNVTIWKKKYTDKISCVKGHGIVPLPPKDIFKYAINSEMRPLYDPICMREVCLEEIDWPPVFDHPPRHVWISACYICLHRVLVVSPRDFLFVKSVLEREDGTLVIATKSIPSHPLASLPPAGVVRGDLVIGGLVMKPLVQANGEIWTDLCCIGATDLKGWIPQYAVNMAISKGVLLVDSLRDFCIKRKQEELAGL